MYTDRKGREILTLDDFFAAIHGKKILHHGMETIVNVAKFKDSRGTRVYLNPTAKGKRSLQYLNDRRIIKDDFDFDVTDSDELFGDIARSAGLRHRQTSHGKTK